MEARQDQRTQGNSPHFTGHNLQTLIHTAERSAPESCMLSKPVPSDTLPHIDPVKGEHKKDIIEGRKYFNLAKLLSASTESGEYIMSEFSAEGGEQISMKEDIKLKRPLTLGEFIKAFGIYKAVFCEAYPHRRDEMDKYERLIVDIASQYGGSLFYEYHRMFATRAASFVCKGIIIDWSIIDTRIYTTVTSGRRTRACTICQSLTHTTEFCFLTSKKDSHFHPYHRNHDSHGRPRSIIDGDEICNNFNDRGCKRDPCIFAHRCITCRKEDTADWIAPKLISGEKRK
ncbi:uncharacterized protein LOC124256711 [Haliotis rubra]|uniref:uncharacterized protein LOC124256711 n=1 Tax=Haliotis rubra TaxID=36100 RepID=UPI001EE5B74E|nr:uncharacterized protein LOC124256711 [Haliotis rubra]